VSAARQWASIRAAAESYTEKVFAELTEAGVVEYAVAQME